MPELLLLPHAAARGTACCMVASGQLLRQLPCCGSAMAEHCNMLVSVPVSRTSNVHTSFVGKVNLQAFQ